MQEFYINKNSTLPLLKMELINDGRNDFNRFYEAIQNSTITFSMEVVMMFIISLINGKPETLKTVESLKVNLKLYLLMEH